MKERTVVFDNWLKARNESCKLMDLGFTRIGVREGFVMVRGEKRNKEIVILKVENERV